MDIFDNNTDSLFLFRDNAFNVSFNLGALACGKQFDSIHFQLFDMCCERNANNKLNGDKCQFADSSNGCLLTPEVNSFN